MSRTVWIRGFPNSILSTLYWVLEFILFRTISSPTDYLRIGLKGRCVFNLQPSGSIYPACLWINPQINQKTYFKSYDIFVSAFCHWSVKFLNVNFVAVNVTVWRVWHARVSDPCHSVKRLARPCIRHVSQCEESGMPLYQTCVTVWRIWHAHISDMCFSPAAIIFFFLSFYTLKLDSRQSWRSPLV